jgi:hypothetical protein
MYFIFLDESLFFFDGPVNICVFLQKISFYFKVFLAIALSLPSLDTIALQSLGIFGILIAQALGTGLLLLTFFYFTND